MDRVVHQLAVLATTTCLGVAAFSFVFPTSKVSHDLTQNDQLGSVSVEVSQTK
ncbi:hypothetical protein [Aphanothece sacrum]|uniref:hypothetical protein n=1 Tax=Aphanothece sacrum TaxID=1122 RepID=UPI0015628A61|nr:hypothetical protein [Aphanothece sacrum]